MASPQVKPVSDLAFNVLLVAYDFDYPDRVPNQLLAVNRFKNAPRIDHLSPTQFTSVPNIRPTRAELAFKANSPTGLWVGMWPSTPPSPNSRSTRRRSSVEQSSSYPIISHDSNALRVIASVSPARRWLYCLVDQEDGLCTALPVEIDDVYFFAEYRDDRETSAEIRKRSLYNKIKFACAMHTDFLHYMGNKLSTHTQDNWTHETAIDTNMSDATTDTGGTIAEIGSLAADENTILYRLATSNDVLSMEECELALQALQSFAPDLESEKYDVQNIHLVSQGLADTGIILDFRHLRPFIVLFINFWRCSSDIDENTAGRTMDCIKAMFASKIADTGTCTLGFHRYLTDEIKKLRSAMVSSRACAKKLRIVHSQELAEDLMSGSDDLKDYMQRLEELRDTLPEVQAKNQQPAQLERQAGI